MTKRWNFQKNARANRFLMRWEFLFLLLALAPALTSALTPLTLAAASFARESLHAAFNMLALHEASSGDPTWLKQTVMRAMLKQHNDYLAEFAEWRGLFARHSEDLAALVKSFPGAENLPEEELRRIFMQTPRALADRHAAGVFEPWTSRWAGLWSNGVPQYHVWDSTRFVHGQWIQAVSLSEYEFVPPERLDASVRRRRADAAINVFTRDHGVTGWVSKYQHGRLEMPHVGYVINDSTLLWICQKKDPARIFARESRWFVFLETVTISSTPVEYRIYGQPILITDDCYAEAAERNLHRGTYHAVTSR